MSLTTGDGGGWGQTPSTGLRHPSFGGRCRKTMLGVGDGAGVERGPFRVQTP